MYTVSGFCGSTVMPPKYHHRDQMRRSLDTRVQLAPASVDLYNPPCFASTFAYTICGLLGDTAMPIRPSPALGNPCPVIGVQVWPSSVDLYSPLPGPLDGGYTLHGGRRVCHSAA